MITSKWKGFGSNFTLVKEQVLDWLAWRTAALLSSANKVTCWHFTTWRVLVWRESQLLLSTMNTREDPMSIPQSTLVRICERKVSQIFYKREKKRGKEESRAEAQTNVVLRDSPRVPCRKWQCEGDPPRTAEELVLEGWGKRITTGI